MTNKQGQNLNVQKVEEKEIGGKTIRVIYITKPEPKKERSREQAPGV